MAGYSRAEFSRHSKDQLLDYIEQQAEQLSRFETRFRDVVRAYKGVLKEKEALETTLKALSVQQEEEGEGEEGWRGEGEEGREGEVTEEGRSDGEVERKEEETDAADRSKTAEVEGASETDDGDKSTTSEAPSTSLSPHVPKSSSISQLKQQLTTLTVAMATLTEEKSKMESNFQKDKKATLSQQESLTKQLQAEREGLRKELAQCQELLDETLSSLQSEQASRSDEQLTHAEMLKELQQLIAVERDNNFDLSRKVREREGDLERLQKQIAEDRTREYEDNLKIMSVELEQVRSRLMAAEKQAEKPPPLLLQLQQDMSGMKEEHLKSIEAEQRRANDAEGRLRAQAEHEELRVASLESKLTELSKTVGTYDKQRENDQVAIQKLKERISQLDSENTALTRAHLERQDVLSNETSGQVSMLQEKLARLKALLKQATLKINEKATLPGNIEELTVSDYNEMVSSEPSRKEYEQELYQLKDEFEKYKLRAQSVLKSRGGKSDTEVTNEELKKLANKNRELQEQLVACQTELEETQERQLLRTSKLREEMRQLGDKHKQQIALLESTHKQKLSELSSQMQSTRERSLKLIAEKDAEIQHLRAELPDSTFSLPSTPTFPQRQKNYRRAVSSSSVSSVTEQVNEESRKNSLESSGEPNNDTSAVASLNLPLRYPSESDSTSTAVQELLEQSSPVATRAGAGVVGGPGEMRLLHYAQEQQRRKEETVLARRKMFELEDTIRDLQEREQRYIEQTGLLKQEIRKQERDRSRETENLEYLKNIIIHYMSADSAGRDQMINPIATVLHFSKEEVAMIKKSIAARRWLTPKKSK